MKVSVGSDPVHEIELLPGFWLTLIAWSVLNFTMGFTGVQWPGPWTYLLAMVALYIIVLYNVIVDKRSIFDICFRRNLSA